MSMYMGERLDSIEVGKKYKCEYLFYYICVHNCVLVTSTIGKGLGNTSYMECIIKAIESNKRIYRKNERNTPESQDVQELIFAEYV